MEKIIVHTQTDLDAIPQDFAGIIKIVGGTRVEPIVLLAHGSARVEAYDSATVVAYGSARVEAYDSARVEAYDSARVEAYDSARVVAHGSARVEASGSARVVAHGFAQIVKTSRRAIAETHDMARCIDPTADIDTFCMYHGIARNGEKSVWYKAVHFVDGAYLSDYDPDYVYNVGETKTAAEIDNNRDRLCGCGIHIATLQWALDYGRDWSNLAILEVEVKTTDVIVPYESDGKCRVDRVKVLREVPLDECGVLGQMLERKRKWTEAEAQ